MLLLLQANPRQLNPHMHIKLTSRQLLIFFFAFANQAKERSVYKLLRSTYVIRSSNPSVVLYKSISFALTPLLDTQKSE